MRLDRIRLVLSGHAGSPFKRNFVKVARANVAAQLIGLAAAPLLTRLFSPADFGIMALFEAVLGLFLAFCTLRVDWSAPNARAATIAASVISLGIVPVLLTAMLSFILIEIWTEQTNVLRADTKGIGLAFLMALAVAAGGLTLLVNAWHVRNGDLTAVSRARVVQSASNSLLGITYGYMNFGAAGLVAASTASMWIGAAVMMAGSGQLWRVSKRITRATMAIAFNRYSAEAGRSTVTSIVNALSLSSTIAIFSVFFSIEQVGWYALMYKLSANPLSLVASALSQSFWVVAADYARSARLTELRALYLRTTWRLSLFAPPILIACAFGPFIVGPVLGTQWREAGFVLFAMSPMLIAFIVLAPTCHLITLRRPELQIISDVIRITIVFIAAWSANSLEWGFVVAVGLASLGYLFSNAVLFWVHLREYARLERRSGL